MTAAHVPQILAALFSALTPLIVVTVVRVMVRRQWPGASIDAAAPSHRLLLGATMAGAVIAVSVAVVVTPPSLLAGAVNLTLFAVIAAIAWRPLQIVSDAAKPAMEVTASIRTASLGRRTPTQFVPAWSRVVFFASVVAGLGWLALRTTSESGDRELAVPLAFAGAVLAFVLLYETWLRELVKAPVLAGASAKEDADARRRLVRQVFGAEAVLATVCLAVAHVLLDLNWKTDAVLAGSLAVAGAVIAVGGCALALGSGLLQRGFAPADR